VRRVALFTLDWFDSTEPKRLCMKHFSDIMAIENFAASTTALGMGDPLSCLRGPNKFLDYIVANVYLEPNYPKYILATI